ncbi:MAG: VIT and VWA domain-containing protein, partial [Thermoanaerobaculia bacterium]
MNDELIRGLFSGDRREIPLEGVKIDARWTGLATQVTVAQRYHNREAVPVEAVYVFPLEEGAAVCGFEARIGDKVVRGRVEERDKAFEIYDDAMADGHGAFLLDQERPNVFTASVGNLRPDETVEIRITYVALARYEGSAMRLTIPTTVSPRYVPPQTGPTVGEPDGERVNPERWFEVPYGLELAVEVDAGTSVRSVDSPSHAVRTTLRDDGARVELSRRQAALDRDFVLLVETAEPHRPLARVCREGGPREGGPREDGNHEEAGTRVCALTFYPDFGDREAGAAEVLFLLDCSGSMIGDSIDQAKRALALSIRALEEDDTFNVVRFGSSFKSLWRNPRPFGERTLEEATRYIEKAGADLGGTEIMAPLKKLLTLRRDPDRRRQILLLTDGEVANEHEIAELAGEHAENARIFTFGIGAGSSEYLVRELARVTRGAAEFIFPGERIEPKVLRMFGRVRAPVFDDVRIDWGGLEVEQAPASVPPVFAGDSLTVFGRVRGGDAAEITLHAGGESWPLALDLDNAEEDGPIPALWARETIRELERGTGPAGSAQRRAGAEGRRRLRLIALGRRYGLTSSATSYVAVEERPRDESAGHPAELRKIPIALTVGWGGHGGLLSGRSRVPMAVGAPPPVLAAARAPAAVDGLMNFASAAIGSFAGGMKALKLGRSRQQAAPRAEMPVRLEEAAAPGASDRLYA